MAKKKQASLFDQAKTWWQTDTAKAIGTVIAVLLIPASVIAWNYLSSSENNIDDEAASIENIENIDNLILDESQMISGDEGQELSEVGGINEVKVLPDTNSKEE